MGLWRRSLGASFIPEDWRVRVFGPYVIVYRLSNCTGYSSIWVHVRTLLLHPLFFSIITGLPQENLIFIFLPWIIIPLRQPPLGKTSVVNFNTAEFPGAYPRLKQCPPITGGGYNLGACSTLVPSFHCKHNCETWAKQDSLINLVTFFG